MAAFNKWTFLFILSFVQYALSYKKYLDSLPILYPYKSYYRYTDNMAYTRELDHIVNIRVSKLKLGISDMIKDLYDARNYDLQSSSEDINLIFNNFINKLIAEYSIVTSMNYHFEILLNDYKRINMRLNKKLTPQGEELFDENAVRPLTYFTARRLDNLFRQMMDKIEDLHDEWERLKTYITRGVSETYTPKLVPTNLTPVTTANTTLR